MPANLTPDYHRAEERFRAAKSAEDKLLALEEMLRELPKHKGTDGLQADLRARMAKLRKQPMSRTARASFSHAVHREGAGQVALVGPPSSGKSRLVATLTHASPEVADYPYTTREATPGMMAFEDAAIQLVDLPPVDGGHVEPWVWDLARAADVLWIVVPVENGLDGFEETLRLLEEHSIHARPAGSEGDGAPAMVVATGLDRDGAAEDLAILRELMDRSWPMLGVSTESWTGLDALAKRTFEALDVIRVYTKHPGEEAARSAPFTLPRGATVGDLAERIHHDLRGTMRFARIWGSVAFDGQNVSAEHPLIDGDVVEIH